VTRAGTRSEVSPRELGPRSRVAIAVGFAIFRTTHAPPFKPTYCELTRTAFGMDISLAGFRGGIGMSRGYLCL
jgi:hypothetical protein